MNKEWVLTQDAFDTLLGWLDSDRDRAGRKYEEIRLRLIKIFTCRGCFEAEELADETINRVSAKVADIAGEYHGDPALYFYGVCQKIQLEHLRKSHVVVSEVRVNTAVVDPREDTNSDNEAEYECLERCLESLSAENRELVIGYYQQEKQAKIDHRKRLARELGIAVNALRIRAHRIRVALEKCVHDCMEQLPAN